MQASDFFLVTVQVILQLRERPDRAAKARRGLTLSLQPLKGFDYDSFLSPPATPDTNLDAGAQTHTAAPLPGPALPLQPAQEKGQRREVFVWQSLQYGYWHTKAKGLAVCIYAHFFILTHRCGAPSKMSYLVKTKTAN